MNKLLVAAAFALTVPAVAQAQEAAAMACCDKMEEGKACDCCKDMAGHEGHDEQAQPAAPAQPHAH